MAPFNIQVRCLKERLGALDADTLASADLEPVFFEKPVVNRVKRRVCIRT